MDELQEQLKRLNSLLQLQNKQSMEQRVADLESEVLALSTTVTELQGILNSLQMQSNRDHITLGEQTTT